jgi:hypothetical protein
MIARVCLCVCVCVCVFLCMFVILRDKPIRIVKYGHFKYLFLHLINTHNTITHTHVCICIYTWVRVSCVGVGVGGPWVCGREREILQMLYNINNSIHLSNHIHSVNISIFNKSENGLAYICLRTFYLYFVLARGWGSNRGPFWLSFIFKHFTGKPKTLSSYLYVIFLQIKFECCAII